MEMAEVLGAVVMRQDGLAAEMSALREQVAQLLRKQERAAWI
jgi:threonine aldolase